MQFDPLRFFTGFLDYLKTERASTVAYLSTVAASERWIQFEAADWLHRNRACLGLGASNSPTPETDVLLEKGKADIWLQDRVGTTGRTGIGIELKTVYNNKNFPSKINGLRRDLSDDRPIPTDLEPNKVSRYGLAILVYVRYLKGSEGSYQYLAGVPSVETFLDRFRDECQARTGVCNQAPSILPMGPVEKIVSLDGQPYVDPDCTGCSVWLAMLERS